MADGLTPELGIAGLCAGIACLFIAMRDLPFSMALVITLIRVSIPVVYFAWYYDAVWNFRDDFVYIERGLDLLYGDYSPFSLLFGEGYAHLQSVADSNHTLYYWWNLIALSLFGEHYYAPVFLNVVATFVGAHIFANMLRDLGFGRAYRCGAQAFVLLHWEIVTWSSLLNAKDSLVWVLTVAALAAAVRFCQTRRLRPLALFLLICGLFQAIRFYVPALMIAGIAIWLALHWKNTTQYLLLLAIGILAGLVLLTYGDLIREYLAGSFMYGILRFILQPLPWKLYDEKSFLLLSGTLHIVFFIPAVLGAIVLWGESRASRLAIIYLAVIICFYAAGEQLQGSRQRIQVSFIFAWCQFHFLWRAQNRTRAPEISGNDSTRVDQQHKTPRSRHVVVPADREANVHV